MKSIGKPKGQSVTLPRCLGCYNKLSSARMTKVTQNLFCRRCRQLLFDGAEGCLNPRLDFCSQNDQRVVSLISKSAIAGYQLKLPICMEDLLEAAVKPNKGCQFILKPIATHFVSPIENMEDLPENEHLTMQIARQVFGLKTADNALIYLQDGRPAYLTRRFDVLDNGLKLAQEDFCQLMNRSAAVNGENFKYDSSYDEMGQIFRKVGTPVTQQEAFFKQILFNYLISNGDAHLKNFSLIRAVQGGYRLSPAYDLLCTRLHTPMESDVALDLFEGDMDFPYYDTYGRYGTPEFLELAVRLGIKESRARRFLADFTSAQKLDQVRQMVENCFLSDSSKEKYIALLKGKRTAFD